MESRSLIPWATCWRGSSDVIAHLADGCSRKKVAQNSALERSNLISSWFHLVASGATAAYNNISHTV
jgi:hypothetical protein